MAFVASQERYILTSLGDWENPDVVNLRAARERAGLVILDDPKSATHPAEQLILRAWITPNSKALEEMMWPERSGVIAISRVLRDEDPWLKVWLAELMPEWVVFKAVTREGNLELRKMKLCLPSSCFNGSLQIMVQDDPEIVVRYIRQQYNPVWAEIWIGGELVMQTKR